MCKFIGKSNERILCKLSKSEILRLYSIVHVAMETTKTSHFTCQSKSLIRIFFTYQVSACELQPFSCHYLTNVINSQTDHVWPRLYDRWDDHIRDYMDRRANPPKRVTPPTWGPSTQRKQALKRSIDSNGDDFTPFITNLRNDLLTGQA